MPVTSAVFRLSGEAALTWVQLKPTLMITSLMPEKKRNVNIDYHKRQNNDPAVLRAELDTPDLLWSQRFVNYKTPHSPLGAGSGCSCFTCGFEKSTQDRDLSYNGNGNPFRFFVKRVDLKKCDDATTWAAGYSVANIDRGYVCWGTIKYPCSLQQAHSRYWQSTLNNSPGKYPVREYNPNGTSLSSEEINAKLHGHMKAYVSDEDWNNKKSEIEGELCLNSAACASLPTGVFISIDPKYKFNAEKAAVGFAFCDFEKNTTRVELNGEVIEFNNAELAGSLPIK